MESCPGRNNVLSGEKLVQWRSTESVDIRKLDCNLTVIVRKIVHGRQHFGNFAKSICITEKTTNRKSIVSPLLHVLVRLVKSYVTVKAAGMNNFDGRSRISFVCIAHKTTNASSYANLKVIYSQNQERAIVE